MGVLSAYVAVKFVQYLSTPFERWDAFKMGLIDKEGKKLRAPKTPAEREEFSSWMNLIRNTKRCVQKFPGGKSLVASLATAYLLLRDSKETEFSSDQYRELLREGGFNVPTLLLTEEEEPDLVPGTILVRPGLLADHLEERGIGPIIEAKRVIPGDFVLGLRTVTLIDTADREIQACVTDLCQG